MVRVGGVLKLTSDSLAQEEPVLWFARTLVLLAQPHADNHFAIRHETLYWDELPREHAGNAFKITTVSDWRKKIWRIKPVIYEIAPRRGSCVHFSLFHRQIPTMLG